MKQTALVVCPGRGTYNAAELGYLKTHHGDKAEIIATLDALRRAEQGKMTVSELDAAEKYAPSVHMTGDNASLLDLRLRARRFRRDRPRAIRYRRGHRQFDGLVSGAGLRGGTRI